MSAAREALVMDSEQWAQWRAQELRDDLAIHAPACPAWFEPVMEPPPLRPDPPENLTADTQALLDNWIGDPCYELEEAVYSRDMQPAERAALVAFEQATNAYHRAMAAHREAIRVERIAQWPWAYADMVLARREARQ